MTLWFNYLPVAIIWFIKSEHNIFIWFDLVLTNKIAILLINSLEISSLFKHCIKIFIALNCKSGLLSIIKFNCSKFFWNNGDYFESIDIFSKKLLSLSISNLSSFNLFFWWVFNLQDYNII